MDREPFDALARMVWTRQSRRAALKLGGLAAGSLLTLGTGHAARAQEGKELNERREARAQAPRAEAARSRSIDGDEVQFVKAWGGPGAPIGQLRDPRGIAIDRRDNIYVVDAGEHQVLKFTRHGDFLTAWGSQGRGDGQFSGPQFIAADKRGDDVVYVADFGNDRVQKFTTGGRFLTSWGKTGAFEGDFREPAGIGLDRDGRVYVVDQGNCRIQVFDRDGELLRIWGSRGKGKGEFLKPTGLAVVAIPGFSPSIFVADMHDELNRIQQFQDDGRFVQQWSTNGKGEDDFDAAYGVGWNLGAGANLYVTDFRGHTVRAFGLEGRLRGEFGSNDNNRFELDEPSGIAVDSTGDIYVSNTGGQEIKKFRLVRRGS